MREFYASGHALGNTGATAFGDMLASNSTLLRLCIGNAEFGDDGLSALCKGLKANSGTCRAPFLGPIARVTLSAPPPRRSATAGHRVQGADACCRRHAW